LYPFIPQNTFDLREVFVAILDSLMILVLREKLQHKREMIRATGALQ